MKEIKRVNGKLILGDGEVTGHVHSVATPGVQLFELQPELLQLRAPEGALLRHTRGDQPAEHRDIQLPSGEPCISYKRAYDPDNGWSKVVD